MKVYHSSDTAQVGTRLINDYKKNIELVRPFVIALKQNKDCFFNLCLSGQYIRAVLGKFNMKNMDTYSVKWATEGLFEYVRQNEFPGLPSRIESNYFFDSIESSNVYLKKIGERQIKKKEIRFVYLKQNLEMIIRLFLI